MDLHVVLENPRPAERPVADGTLVRTDASVDAPVDFQVRRRREAFPTNLALERFPSAVRQHVVPQMFRPAEHLAAERALMHLFAGVDTVVPREVTLLRKSLIAHGTSIRSFSRMRPPVDPQQTLVFEALPAFRT